MADESFMTPGEVAAALRTSVSTVRRLISGGKLSAVEAGPRTVRIPVAEYERFIGKGVGQVPEMSGRG